MTIYGALLQLPGITAPERTFSEQVEFVWAETGFMRWPLLLTAVVGLIVIVWKFFSLWRKASVSRKLLKEVDELLAKQRIDEAVELTRSSNSPAGKILYAGLERHEEGTERVMKAIENQGLIEMSKFESGLVVMATVTNIAPLLGFLGTVVGMIIAFQAIEAAGEVEATLVAGGIKVALLTTAEGLCIAIPVSIAQNYFISRIDAIVLEMEESAQKMIDALHSIERGRQAAAS
jgi:biopolymer transport protein ExbB